MPIIWVDRMKQSNDNPADFALSEIELKINQALADQDVETLMQQVSVYLNSVGLSVTAEQLSFIPTVSRQEKLLDLSKRNDPLDKLLIEFMEGQSDLQTLIATDAELNTIKEVDQKLVLLFDTICEYSPQYSDEQRRIIDFTFEMIDQHAEHTGMIKRLIDVARKICIAK